MITTIEKVFSVDYGQKEFEIKGEIEEGKTILIASGAFCILSYFPLMKR